MHCRLQWSEMESYDPAGLLANGRSLMVRRINLVCESEAMQPPTTSLVDSADCRDSPWEFLTAFEQSQSDAVDSSASPIL